MDRHYDLTYLNQVFHGNEAMVRQIVELFLKQAPEAVSYTHLTLPTILLV